MLSKQNLPNQSADNENVADLNYIQKEAISVLKGIKGLTVTHFRNAPWFNSVHHIDALRHLLTKDGLHADEAMSLLARLKKAQIYGITYGLTLSDVEMFEDDDSHVIYSLVAFKSHGLRATHLVNKPWTALCNTVLLTLLTRKKMPMSLELALATLFGSTKEEQYGLSNGLEPDQVKGLNLYQMRALYQGQHQGITSEVLRSHPWFDNNVAEDALTFYLSHNIPGAQALAEIKTLLEKIAQEERGAFKPCFTDLQRNCIKELVRKQRLTPQQGQVALDPIEKLNEFQKEAYLKTTSKGVRPEDFDNKVWFKTKPHVTAFEHLIMERCLSIQEAMEEIQGLETWQLICLRENLLRKVEVLQLHNIAQSKFLYRFKPLSLTAEQLYAMPWLKSSQMLAAAQYLIEVNKMPLFEALTFVQGLTASQANFICYGFELHEVRQLTEQDIAKITTLNAHQNSCLGEIEKSGIKAHHFYRRPWCNTIQHTWALEYLINKKKYLLQEAFDEIDAMNWEQADLIKEGFSRADLIHLNSFQLQSLKKHYEKGLSVELLKSFPHFDSVWHGYALDDLIEAKMEPNDALIKLYDCDFTEVRDSRSKEEAINPSKKTISRKILNDYQRNSLWLRYRGLQEQDFYYRPWFDSIHHQRALTLLIEKGYSIKEAFDEIDLFNWQQASLINCGFKRKDIVVLSIYQIHSLRRYYKQGLELELLKNFRQFNNIWYSIALDKLIHIEKMTPKDALAKLFCYGAYELKKLVESSTIPKPAMKFVFFKVDDCDSDIQKFGERAPEHEQTLWQAEDEIDEDVIGYQLD